MENTALTNATRGTSPSTAEDSRLSSDSELDVSMIIDKIQHLKSQLKSASDKLDKPVNVYGMQSLVTFLYQLNLAMTVLFLTIHWLTVRLFLASLKLCDVTLS